MKKIINYRDFERAFCDHGRADQFSPEGLRVLFDHLEEYEQETGQDIELDVIAICCDFVEYENFAEFKADYRELDINSIKDIKNYTQVIPINNESFIIQVF